MVWNYDNYCTVGAKMSRAPQTLRQLSSGSPTAEEFHCVYDTGGRMQAASFAMTPASGFTPTGSNPWYDSTHLASTRARVLYDNGPTNENLNLYYYWDTWNSGSYTAGTITGFQYGYDTTTLLKTGATFLVSNGSGGWNTGHSESYGYDPNLDYLTSVNYGDGYSNATDTWSYDAAGNRASDADNSGSWSYDNLNRMTASPFGSYTNDKLGNRLTLGSSTSYGWDQLNRMTSFTSGAATTTYAYRSDGLRVSKSNPGGSPVSTSFAYDGQMGFEDVDSTATPTITDYAIGARGIDWISKRIQGSVATIAFPIFDGHGNMVQTLERNGTSFSSNDQRAYDAWGAIRSTDTSGDPKGRYCANLGHKSDDESGLIYMRARYYEPGSGRFVSEDPDMVGANWFSYANGDPVGMADISGRSAEFIGAVVEFVKSCSGSSAATPIRSEKTFFKVTIKTAYGIQEGVVTRWAWNMFVKTCQVAMADAEDALGLGGGSLAAGVLLCGNLLRANLRVYRRHPHRGGRRIGRSHLGLAIRWKKS